MKITTAIAAISLAISGIAATADHTSRHLITGGTVVPIGTKTYTCGLRSTPSAGHSEQTPLFVSAGSHVVEGTSDGEQIKVVSVQNHTYHEMDGDAFDFALLTLGTPSKFKPVKLVKRDESDIIIGMSSTVLGWGKSTPDGPILEELQALKVSVWNNEECARLYDGLSDLFMCAGGILGRDTCDGDNGSPLIKEMGSGDDDDILIALSSVSVLCGTQNGVPSTYFRVSIAIDWLESIICAGSQQCQFS
ncbi:putative serine protease, trypsin domain, peptidase S1, PA clan [Plasmopara halstedii]